MLLMGPFFLMVIMIVPIGLAMEKENASEILCLDQSGELAEYLYTEPGMTLIKTAGTTEECFLAAKKGGYAGLLHINKDSASWQTRFYPAGMSGQNPALLKAIIQRRITEYELEDKQNVTLPEIEFKVASLTEITKNEPDGTMGFVAGLFAAVLVLVFINQYSHMVLRGIVEEKQNRISELILTSIKPIYFITGKIAGIASVAFLQIMIWAVLSGLVTFSVQSYFKLDRFKDQNIAETLKQASDVPQTLEMNSMLNSISSINGGALIAGFLFYFVFGYLLYSAVFAIIGIAVGSDTDAQQMAIPFTLPLAIPVVLLQYITEHPEAGFTRFLTIFPLTSPTTMLLRMPLGVPLWEGLLSGGILLFTLFIAAFSAAKVYRIGIFMYGKKLSWTEVIRLAKQS